MNLLNLCPGPSQEHSAAFVISVESLPCLADHRLQDMVLVPGMFFVEMAAVLHRELFKQHACRFKHIKFLTPVILSVPNTVVRVEVIHRESSVHYRFSEKTRQDENVGTALDRDAATLEIPLASSDSPEVNIDLASTNAFQARADAVISSTQFYERLRRNGNQYGPAFQHVISIWRHADEILGRISAGDQSAPAGVRSSIYPILLDSATQLLAGFVLEQRRGFVLRSIDEVELNGLPGSELFWSYAQRSKPIEVEGESLAGDIRVFRESGTEWARLRGVAIDLLDPVRDSAEDALTFVVAANFTAEPVADSIQFWADHFGATVQLKFAPYNQIFQQLLDPQSAFHENHSGANLVLLALEDWAAPSRKSPLRLTAQKAEECFGSRKRYTLPNGLDIVHLNAYETDYVYREIFEDECYLRHGITLPDRATVVDIGANIGLFSLFTISRCQDAQIYAFEPAPVTYDLLKANCDAYGANVRTYNVGVSHKPGIAPFTFYENSSVFSGFHSEEGEDMEAIQAVVRNVLNRAAVADDSVDEYVRELSSNRLRLVTHDCPVTNVSEIILENRIEVIDLLKIDAEKSELDVLHGIREQDWQKIRQIVIEIHDRFGAKVKNIQGMLTERGYRCAVEEENLLEGSGLVNLYATRNTAPHNIHSDSVSAAIGSAGSRASENELEHNVVDFCSALEAFMKKSSAPLVLCLCPRAPGADAEPRQRAALDMIEQELLAETSKIVNVAVITSAALFRQYPVTDFYDPHTHQAGHIPYTREGYAAIGTALFRVFSGMKRNPFKVIVLDCDNTLWRGICGEDGLSGIEVTKPYRDLQEFMLVQMRAGMLLCLCSRNNEQDVLDVLARRSDMLLRGQDLAGWRINWNSKSENIKALADELKLGLDSFIFLDDNAVDCADVRINCPDVLTLQLPRDPESFLSFLQNVWAFDHLGSTLEDQTRTRMYQENAQRERFRDQTVTLRDFIEGLQLHVQITEATEEEFSRISQLTFRTNQFNFTTVRRSESEIHKFLERDGYNCLAVRVSDRFGNYGLVGVVLYEAATDCYKVDTFLLSCRVLGKGVEHAVLRQISQRALLEGKVFVELAFRRTEKNQPALAFLESLGMDGRAGCSSLTLRAERLAELDYNTGQYERAALVAQGSSKSEPSRVRSSEGFGSAGQNERLQQIGEQLCDISRIVNAMERHRHGTQSATTTVAELGGTLLSRLGTIWRRVLGTSAIGMDDNFFEAGGTSLKAVQLVATIKRELKQSLSIASVFEYPTLNLMAARLGAGEGMQNDKITEAAMLRGQQRRYKAARKPR